MLELKDIKRGMYFYEQDCGMELVLEAIEDAHEINEEMQHGWTCKARVIEGHAGLADEDGVVTYFEAYNPGCYGLRLYKY